MIDANLAGLAAAPISVRATIFILIRAWAIVSPSGSDLFTQPPGSLLWRTPASQLARQPLGQPLDIPPTQTLREGGRDGPGGLPGDKTHRDKISGDLGRHL
ncbi:MAG: hypothetical protein DMD82_03205 [Candidatus Rokuibacteriota bacterium]|nr:MAG: hypothetical protein DMD82_03205 [Candidatus Rokubacteria bacterium]